MAAVDKTFFASGERRTQIKERVSAAYRLVPGLKDYTYPDSEVDNWMKSGALIHDIERQAYKDALRSANAVKGDAEAAKKLDVAKSLAKQAEKLLEEINKEG